MLKSYSIIIGITCNFSYPIYTRQPASLKDAGCLPFSKPYQLGRCSFMLELRINHQTEQGRICDRLKSVKDADIAEPCFDTGLATDRRSA